MTTGISHMCVSRLQGRRIGGLVRCAGRFVFSQFGSGRGGRVVVEEAISPSDR